MAKKRSRIQIGKVVTLKGKKYKISAGTAKGKKYKATPVDGSSGVIQFGAKGYKVGPGTPRIVTGKQLFQSVFYFFS